MVDFTKIKQGKTIELSNEDQTMHVELHERKGQNNTWANGFYIWQNARLMHTFKSYRAFKSKAKQIIHKYQLKPTENALETSD